jgi:hypothetical protein
MTRANYLRDVLGFDLSTMTRGGARVRCSRCESLVINGTPAHERGCPNATRECDGCNARIPMNQRYCEGCQ